MTLKGKTPSRFLLNAARVVLSNEQFANGYLPDYVGDKSGKVPIPQECVDKLKGFNNIDYFNKPICSFLQRLYECVLVIENKT